MLKKFSCVWIAAVAGGSSSAVFAADTWSAPFRVEKIEVQQLGGVEFTVSEPKVADASPCVGTKNERKFIVPIGMNQAAFLSLLMSSMNLNNKLKLRYPGTCSYSSGRNISGFEALELSL